MDLYTLNKVAHMKRIGLCSSNSRGIGKNGGACPDWLYNQQKAEREARGRAYAREIYTAWEKIQEAKEVNTEEIESILE